MKKKSSAWSPFFFSIITRLLSFSFSLFLLTQVKSLGKFWAEEAWLPLEYPDDFGRSASVMPYDRQDRRINLEDSRAYAVGLSDDGGAASNLGFATKVRRKRLH